MHKMTQNTKDVECAGAAWWTGMGDRTRWSEWGGERATGQFLEKSLSKYDCSMLAGVRLKVEWEIIKKINK